MTKLVKVGNKYFRTIHNRDDVDGRRISCTVDVYRVLAAFVVTCPCVAHAAKKVLCAGLRGKATQRQDLVEAIEALEQAIQLLDSREAFAREQQAKEAAEETNQGCTGEDVAAEEAETEAVS